MPEAGLLESSPRRGFPRPGPRPMPASSNRSRDMRIGLYGPYGWGNLGDAAIQEAIAESGDPTEAQGIRAGFMEMPTPDRMPAFLGLDADLLGFLWVEEYRVPGVEARLTTIFDPDGRMVGSVVLPNRLRVEEIGADYLLGRASDDLGVEPIGTVEKRDERPGVEEYRPGHGLRRP